MTLTLVWLHARSYGARAYASALSAGTSSEFSLYNGAVMDALARCGAVQLQRGAEARVWSGSLSCQRNLVVAAVLLDLWYSPSIFSVLTTSQRAIRMFWLSTKWAGDPSLSVKRAQCAGSASQTFLTHPVWER